MTETTTTFDELLDTQGYLVYTNVGVSMMPLLRQRRDIIEIHRRPPGRCRKYDVILYKRGGKYILHRILKVRLQDYVVAGDNNAYLEKVTDPQIIGVMTRVIRDGRSVTMDNRRYRLYVHLWCDAYPVRMLILKVRNRLRRMAWQARNRLRRDRSRE